MLILTKLVAVTILVTASNLCKGQSSTSAFASATIVSPVGLISNGDISFVNLKGSSLDTSIGTEQHFTVVGNSFDVYSLTVPASLNVINIKTGHTLNATTSVSIIKDSAGINSNNALRIDAIVVPSADHVPGLYISKNFELIVSYN